MKKRQIDLKLHSFATLCLLLTLSQSAEAGQRNRDYRTTCEKGASSDQQKSYCAQAKMSLTTKDGETVKTVAFLAGSVATAVLAATTVISGGSNEGTCTAISYGLSGLGIATDAYVGIKNGDVMGSLLGSVTGLIGGFGASAALDSLPKIGEKIAGSGAKACIGATVSLAIQGLKSGMGVKTARAAFDASLSSAKTLADTRAAQIPSNFSATMDGSKGHAAGETAKYAAKAEGSEQLCGSDANYTACIKNAVPEISAITNSPALMGEINKRLNGQSFGDFLKGYDSDKSSPEDYVANAMGVSGAAMGAYTASMTKVAKDAGALDHYSPMAYASNSKAATAAGGDLDFSKMMGDMLKQLNPDGSAKTDSKEGADLVFRQLDLLPPDKIEANKNISLFARVGYRYRKKSNDVEQLNYARPENQTQSSAQAGVPAPVPAVRMPATTH